MADPGTNGAFSDDLKPLRADGADLFPVRAALWRIYCLIRRDGVRMGDSGQHFCLGRECGSRGVGQKRSGTLVMMIVVNW